MPMRVAPELPRPPDHPRPRKPGRSLPELRRRRRNRSGCDPLHAERSSRREALPALGVRPGHRRGHCERSSVAYGTARWKRWCSRRASCVCRRIGRRRGGDVAVRDPHRRACGTGGVAVCASQFAPLHGARPMVISGSNRPPIWSAAASGPQSLLPSRARSRRITPARRAGGRRRGGRGGRRSSRCARNRRACRAPRPASGRARTDSRSASPAPAC